MKRKTALVAILLAALITAASPVFGQKRARTSQTAGKSVEKQSFRPRVIGRAESFIVEGVITGASAGSIRIKSMKGERLTLDTDEQTTVIESGELVSIAAMGEIELDPSDLRVSDRVEIVFEREGGRRLARIITRIPSERDQLAKR